MGVVGAFVGLSNEDEAVRSREERDDESSSSLMMVEEQLWWLKASHWIFSLSKMGQHHGFYD